MLPLANSALREVEAALEPAQNGDFRNHLTACLVLVAPTGMTKEDRNEWLRVAWGTLKLVPADMLARGCDVARRTCDHPSKIVACIMREIETSLAQRRRDLFRIKDMLANVKNEQSEAPPADGYCTPEQVAAIKAEFGLSSDTENRASVRANLGPARKPTPAELRDIAAAMGIAATTGQALPPVADVCGLTIAEIFAQRDRRAAEALMREGWGGDIMDDTGADDHWRSVA